MGTSPDNLTENKPVNRRGFIKFLLGFTAVSTVIGTITPIIGYLIPPPSVSAGGGGRVLVGTTEDIPAGQGKVVPMGGKPVIVVSSEQGVHAFSAICTHLGCIVTYDPVRKLIICPCHDGQFNPVTGAVVGGPPPTGLAPIPASIDGKNIFVGEA
jgi:cytochrome b6-f complex iron-sulfur subunit